MAPDQRDQPCGQPVSELLRYGQRACFALARDPRPDHHVGAVLEDRVDKSGHLARVVAIVAIEEDDDIGSLDGRDAGQACPAVSGLRLRHHAGAGRAGPRRRLIPRAVVCDDRLVDPVRDVADDLGDRIFLVARRNDDGYALSTPHYISCSNLPSTAAVMAGLFPSSAACARPSARRPGAGARSAPIRSRPATAPNGRGHRVPRNERIDNRAAGRWLHR